jgi:hypothetical protein
VRQPHVSIGSAIVIALALNIAVAIALAQELTGLTTSGVHDELVIRTEGTSCGGTLIMQNTNPNVITSGTVACAATGGGPTTENAFARSYHQ